LRIIFRGIIAIESYPDSENDGIVDEERQRRSKTSTSPEAATLDREKLSTVEA
jgi:hypothetical protein